MDPKQYQFLEIPINKLLLDPQNPRHNVLESQPETLREIIANDDEGLVNLAKDIVDKGLNPSDSIIVIHEDADGDEYVVLEGNRRLAAIKLLFDPSLADLEEKATIKKFFREHSQKFKENLVEKLRCVVFKNRDDATHWIQLKHTGPNDGVGVVEWDAVAKARFKRRLGIPNLALQVVEFVKKNATLDETARENLENIPLTNVVRLVNDPDVRSALGLHVNKDGEAETNLPPSEIIKGLTKIVTDVANKDITVNDIRHKTDRQRYLKSFAENEGPDKSLQIEKSWALSSQINGFTATTSQTKTKLKKKRVSVSLERKTLIPSQCSLNIHHPRLKKIFQEFKGLNVEEYPNACAVMLRVFLELSLEEYVKGKRISFSEGQKLGNKLKKVADYFEQNNLMDKNELKPVRVAYSSKDALFSTDTLHAYIHNKDFSPKPRYLKETWDDMQKFLEVIWS